MSCAHKQDLRRKAQLEAALSTVDVGCIYCILMKALITLSRNSIGYACNGVTVEDLLTCRLAYLLPLQALEILIAMTSDAKLHFPTANECSKERRRDAASIDDNALRSHGMEFLTVVVILPPGKQGFHRLPCSSIRLQHPSPTSRDRAECLRYLRRNQTTSNLLRGICLTARMDVALDIDFLQLPTH